MWRVLVLALAGAMLCGCATISYLRAEYGGADKDGTVTMADGTGWWIFQHKSKPKLMVVADPAQAAAIGAVAGLTFGAVSGAIPPPMFEAVARQWFVQIARAECRTVGGHPIDRLYYEFDIVCVAAPAAPVHPRRR